MYLTEKAGTGEPRYLTVWFGVNNCEECGAGWQLARQFHGAAVRLRKQAEWKSGRVLLLPTLIHFART